MSNFESTVDLTYTDGVRNKLSVFTATTHSPYVFIVFPALGVRASFYKKLATKIAEKGYHAATVDWRGQGQSSIRAQRGVNYSYSHLITDLKAAVELIKEQFPNSEPILIGHSLGGQLGSLLISRYPELVYKISIIAACSVYYKGWSGLTALRIWLAGWSLPLMARLIGHYPGDKLGFGGREFAGVMQDWGNNAHNGKYDLINDDFNYEIALQNVSAQVKSFTVEGDWMATPKALKNLTAKFGNHTSVEYTHLTATLTASKLNHFSWAKESDKVVDLLTAWE